MWIVTRAGQLTATVLGFFCVLSAGASLGQLQDAEHRDHSLHYKAVELRDISLHVCDVERPTEENFKKHKKGDVEWLRGHFERFVALRRRNKLERDEKTFPAWFVKLLAPDHPPSSMICDGLNSCIVSI
jgi:hypothetical protein